MLKSGLGVKAIVLFFLLEGGSSAFTSWGPFNVYRLGALQRNVATKCQG